MASITYHVQGQGLNDGGAGLSQIVLGLCYVDTSHTYSTSQWCVLTPSQPGFDWTFDPGIATAGTLFYWGRQVDAAWIATQIPMTVAATTTISVGRGVQPLTTVEVASVLVDWTRVTGVSVTIAGQTTAFTAASPQSQFLALTAANYSWAAVYTLADGSAFTASQTSTASTLLIVPPVPPLSQITFAPVASDFSTLPVQSIALTVSNPGGQPVKTVFTADASQPFTASVFQTPVTPLTWTLSYTYRYVVTYTSESGLPPFDSGDIDGGGALSNTISEVGIRNFVLAQPMPGIITAVTVGYTVNGAPASRTLPVLLIAGQDYTPGAFSYALTYTIGGTADGASGPQMGTYWQAGINPAPAFVTASNPLQLKSIVFSAPHLKRTDRIQLSPAGFENGNLGLPLNAWSITGVAPDDIVLSASAPGYTYTFAAIAPETAVANVNAIYLTGNTQTPVESVAIENAVTLSMTTLPFTVILNPSAISWPKVSSVTVELWFTQSPSDIQTFTFTINSGYFYANSCYQIGSSQPLYGYKATYAMKDGTSTHVSAQNVWMSMLMIPPLGS